MGQVGSASTAARELAAFVAEVRGEERIVVRRADATLTFDEAVERYLDEYLRDEKGREGRTIEDYRELHRRWFSPHIGTRPVRDINDAMMDRLFGKMRRAGLSRSRLNHAKSLYSPFFRWALRRRFVSSNPMLGFQLPTSSYVSRQQVRGSQVAVSGRLGQREWTSSDGSQHARYEIVADDVERLISGVQPDPES